VAADVVEVNGIVGRNGVEVLTGDVTVFVQLGVVPASARNPSAFG
jgi:hypothetical protein